MKTIVVAIAFILTFPPTITVLTSPIAITGLDAGTAEMAIIVTIAAIVGYFVARAVSRKQKS